MQTPANRIRLQPGRPNGNRMSQFTGKRGLLTVCLRNCHQGPATHDRDLPAGAGSGPVKRAAQFGATRLKSIQDIGPVRVATGNVSGNVLRPGIPDAQTVVQIELAVMN